MNAQTAHEQTVESTKLSQTERPRYETPRIQALSEQEILSTFQITQSMATWWTTM